MNRSFTGAIAGEKTALGIRNILVSIHDNDTAVIPFYHALRLVYAAQGELEIVDVRSPEERINNIGVRRYLEQWGVLPEGSRRGDVAEAGIRVSKVAKSGNQRSLVKKWLNQQHPHDLLVIGTELSKTTTGVFSTSLAAYLADYFHHSTLFFPVNARPFVDEITGTIALKRVLMPVENQEFFTSAYSMLFRMIALFPMATLEVTLLHVGSVFPPLVKESSLQVQWKEVLKSGAVVDAITLQAEESCADLVVMATNGRDTLSRKIIGSTTEHLLQKIACPVLSVATHSKKH